MKGVSKMQITVVDENLETIFEGDADDYLFENDNEKQASDNSF